jgi:hypothetical protein
MNMGDLFIAAQHGARLGNCFQLFPSMLQAAGQQGPQPKSDALAENLEKRMQEYFYYIDKDDAYISPYSLNLFIKNELARISPEMARLAAKAGKAAGKDEKGGTRIKEFVAEFLKLLSGKNLSDVAAAFADVASLMPSL